MSVIKMMKLTDGFCGWLDIHDHRCVFAYGCTYHQPTIGITKRQLTIFLIIVINHECIKVMQFNKGPETGIAVLLVVFVEMFFSSMYSNCCSSLVMVVNGDGLYMISVTRRWRCASEGFPT